MIKLWLLTEKTDISHISSTSTYYMSIMSVTEIYQWIIKLQSLKSILNDFIYITIYKSILMDEKGTNNAHWISNLMLQCACYLGFSRQTSRVTQ